jgi:hypothetical protein
MVRILLFFHSMDSSVPSSRSDPDLPSVVASGMDIRRHGDADQGASRGRGRVRTTIKITYARSICFDSFLRVVSCQDLEWLVLKSTTVCIPLSRRPGISIKSSGE